MSDFIKAENGDVVHRIAELRPDGALTVCGREIQGERVDDGTICSKCGGGS